MNRSILFSLLIIAIISSCDGLQDKAGRFFLKANDAMLRGENVEAIRLYSEAINKNPEYKEAWNNRGVANYKEKRYVEAINDYTQVLVQIDPDFTDARRNRVNAYLDVGRYERALEDLDILESTYPDSAYINFTRGLVYHEMKEFQNSIDEFGKAGKKGGDKAEVLINQANGYFMMKDNKQALQLLDKAESLDAQEPNIYNTRSLIKTYQTVPEYEIALEEVNQALKLESNNPYFLSNRAFILLMLDRADDAQNDIRLSIMGAPENAWAFRNRGIALYMREDYEAAIRNFQLASELSDMIPMMTKYWVCALAAQGKIEEAKKLLNNANEQNAESTLVISECIDN